MLARFAFSFFIIAAVLGWEAHRVSSTGGAGWRSTLYLLAAGMAVLLGLAGIRQRHRRDDGQ